MPTKEIRWDIIVKNNKIDDNIESISIIRINLIVITIGVIWGVVSYTLLKIDSINLSYYQMFLTLSYLANLFYGDNFVFLCFFATLINCILLSVLLRFLFLKFVKNKPKKILRAICSLLLFVISNFIITFIAIAIIFNVFGMMQPKEPIETESIQVQ